MVAVCEKLGLSPLVAKLLEGMLNPDVQSRFSIQQVLASEWLAPLQQEAEALGDLGHVHLRLEAPEEGVRRREKA